MNTLHNFLFNVYPYICLSVFLMGSLARFDRDQYTWKSDSSQLLRKGQLRWGSNLFHIGILFLFGGHTVGLLTPHFMYEPFITAEQKQLVAVTAGGIAGVICFIGLTLLLHRRIFDDRIRLTSHRTDLAILIILWVQLVLGLITLPYSFGHKDAGVMLALADWAQRHTSCPNAMVDRITPRPPPELRARVLAATGRAVHSLIGWSFTQYMRAPLASTAVAAMLTLTTVAGSNALYFQEHRHPAPLFGVDASGRPAGAVNPKVAPVVPAPRLTRPAATVVTKPVVPKVEATVPQKTAHK